MGMGHHCHGSLLDQCHPCSHVRSTTSIRLDVYFERFAKFCGILCNTRYFRSRTKRSTPVYTGRQGITLLECTRRRTSCFCNGHGKCQTKCQSCSTTHRRRSLQSHLHFGYYWQAQRSRVDPSKFRIQRQGSRPKHGRRSQRFGQGDGSIFGIFAMGTFLWSNMWIMAQHVHGSWNWNLQRSSDDFGGFAIGQTHYPLFSPNLVQKDLWWCS